MVCNDDFYCNLTFLFTGNLFISEKTQYLYKKLKNEKKSFCKILKFKNSEIFGFRTIIFLLLFQNPEIDSTNKWKLPSLSELTRF